MRAGWKRNLESWRIELVERGKNSLCLMEVREKKRIKLNLPEESKVTRDLKEIRKNA
jgi:hypothetical protein